MKILFTKSEYRTLFDMIYMAEWMLTAYDEDPDESKEKYNHLAQKIYSHAKEMGWDSLVEVATAENLYVPNREYEDKSGVHELIEQYDADTFWDQLVERLTERDVEIKAGDVDQQVLSEAAFSAIADPIADAYEREFAANGIERLVVNSEQRLSDA
jgi:hypothetical protein